MPKPRPLISVIVPTLNEERVISNALSDLLRKDSLHECIVVDGGSTDRTTHHIGNIHDPRLSLLHGAPGRGTQMNLGAQQATGEILLFHHADTHLPEGAFEELAKVTQDSSVLWGGFGHRFHPSNWKLRLVSALHNYRFRRTGVVYGDQSMFARREFFANLGGFPEEPLEDLIFSDKALEHAPSHRLDHYVMTESRKFTQMGEAKAFAHVVNIVLRYQFNRRFASQQFFDPYR